MSEQHRPSRVVIVGGGFAGIFAARALRGGPFSVTVGSPGTELEFAL